jgi:hypothetical protein
MSRGRWWSEADVRAAVADSLSYAEVLRRLGLRAAGGNHRTVCKYVDDIWRIPTGHFDRARARGRAPAPRAVPLADVLVERSTYHRGHLKRRLLAENNAIRKWRRACEADGAPSAADSPLRAADPPAIAPGSRSPAADSPVRAPDLSRTAADPPLRAADLPPIAADPRLRAAGAAAPGNRHGPPLPGPGAHPPGREVRLAERGRATAV